MGGWTGPTGFLYRDFRAPLAPDESTTWSALYVWADPTYGNAEMPFSMEIDAVNPPPANRTYLLTLVARPEGVVGGPPAGTIWELSLERLLTLYLPTYGTTNGLAGYQFEFTVTAAPEPATLTALALAMMFLRRR